MRSPEENRRLACKEFNRILKEDPVLRELESRIYDKGAETRILLATMGLGRWNIGRLPVLPLTAAKWAFLWILDNGFVTGRPVVPEDVDTFLFVLSQPDLRKLALPLHAIPGAASGCVVATGLSAEEVLREIRSVIQDAFRPLGLIPWGGDASSEGEPKYDALWLTRICSIAARGSGMKADDVCYEMPLATVCCHFVNHLMAESDDPGKFQRDPDEETLAAMDARFDILADEFLKRKE